MKTTKTTKTQEAKNAKRIAKAASAAASEITDLWWARPDQNGHVKAEIVERIITAAFLRSRA